MENDMRCDTVCCQCLPLRFQIEPIPWFNCNSDSGDHGTLLCGNVAHTVVWHCTCGYGVVHGCGVDGYGCSVDGYGCGIDGYGCGVDRYRCGVDRYGCSVDGYRCSVDRY